MKLFKNTSMIFVLFSLVCIKTSQAAIGVLNIRIIAEQAPQAIVLTQVIENDFKERKQRLIALEKKIEKKNKVFNQRKEFLSKEEKQKKLIALQKMRDGMNALENEFKTDYVIRQKEEMEKFFVIVRKYVKEIAREKKMLIILHSEAVFWSNSNIDITDNVLSILNKSKS